MESVQSLISVTSSPCNLFINFLSPSLVLEACCSLGSGKMQELIDAV